MRCWNCGRNVPEKAKVCQFCEATIEPEPTEEEKKLVGDLLERMPPGASEELQAAFEQSETAEDFANRILVGECPQCGSTETGDCVLELDFKMGPKAKANSGVFIRVHDRNQDVATGMEIQILDNEDYKVPFNAGNANGALYDLVRPAVDANKPIGRWNHFRITARDNLITVELNGQGIVRADLNQWTKAGQNPDGGHNKFPRSIGALPREGFICLQNYGATPVWFKNIRLKPLTDRKPRHTGKEPINEVLR